MVTTEIKMIDKMAIEMINKKGIRKMVKQITKMIKVMNTTALRKLNVNDTLPG
jgi:hypothetical protein